MNGQKIGTEKNSYKTKRNVTGPYTKVNLCFYYVGMITIVWFQKISIPPPTEGICRMTPLPSGFSKIGPQNLPPLPSGISKIFAHPLEILLSLIEVNKEVVEFYNSANEM